MSMRRMNRFWAAAAIVAAVTAPASAQQPGVTADSIKIGSFGALTGPGYLYGKLPMNGVEVVFDEVNAAGGIHGRKLQLVREDDRCDPAAAIAAVQKLVHQDQVFALIGGGCSNATLAARESIETRQDPDGHLRLGARRDHHAARTKHLQHGIHLAIESQAQVAFAQEQGAKRIAVISMRDAWGRSRYTALMDTLEGEGRHARRGRGAFARRQRRHGAGAAPEGSQRGRRPPRALPEARSGLPARFPEARLQAAQRRPERHCRSGRVRGAGRVCLAPPQPSAPSRR